MTILMFHALSAVIAVRLCSIIGPDNRAYWHIMAFALDRMERAIDRYPRQWLFGTEKTAGDIVDTLTQYYTPAPARELKTGHNAAMAAAMPSRPSLVAPPEPPEPPELHYDDDDDADVAAVKDAWCVHCDNPQRDTCTQCFYD